MENTSSNLKSQIIQYGLLLGGISVAFNLMLFFLDMHYTQESSVMWINMFILPAAVIVFGIYNHRSTNDGYLSLGEALKLGLGISVISGLIAVVYTYVLYNFLDPDTVEKAFEVTQNKMLEQNPEMSQEQIDQVIEMQKKFSGFGITSAMIMIWSLLVGLIISLIGGLILKRNQPE